MEQSGGVYFVSNTLEKILWSAALVTLLLVEILGNFGFPYF